MHIEFEGEIVEWRGPAPFLFVPIPEEPSAFIKALAGMLTYGWGVIPAQIRIGATRWQTSLFPKDGRYLVPIKQRIQQAEKIGVGDQVTVDVELG